MIFISKSRPSLRLVWSFAFTFIVLCSASSDQTWAKDPLPSWRDGSAKQAITNFVSKTTEPGNAEFVSVPERIAVFDNDGTLWCEKPFYVQLAFALDRVKTLAPQHPEWKEQEPFKSILAGNQEALLASGEEGIFRLLSATHAGISTDEFEQAVADWIKTAKHPQTGRLYTEMVYQPMLELLVYLRENGYRTYIVSGGGVDFMRPWTEKVYGIPREQVIGSRAKMKLEVQAGKQLLMKLPEVDHVNDGPGKPVGIEQIIGRRPVMAFGNSDGDMEMLKWTTSGQGPRFGLIVHHTDDEREYAYDKKSSVGKLDKALSAAEENKWTVVDMKKDWKKVFPPQK